MNQVCDLCERYTETSRHQVNSKPCGQLCQHCKAICDWIIQNGWIANRAMNYLMKCR